MVFSRTDATTVYVGLDGAVFGSSDNGGAWTELGTGLPDDSVATLVTLPGAGDVLRAGTWGGGVWAWDGSGPGWGEWNTGMPATYLRVNSLVLNEPTSTLYAAMDSYGIYTTGTASVNWQAATAGLPHLEMRALAVFPGDPPVLYAGGSYSSWKNDYGGVYRSADGGATWTGAGLAEAWIGTVEALVIHPSDSDVVYAGTSAGVFKTIDAGANWSQVGTFGSVSALYLDPVSPDHLYTAGPSGIFKTVNGGTSWSDYDDGLRRTYYFALGMNSAALFAGGYGSGVSRRASDSVPWETVNSGLDESSVTAVEIDPLDSRIVYAGVWGQGVFKRGTGGAWTRAADGVEDPASYNGGLHFIQDLALAPSDADTLYLGTNAGMFRSENRATTWVNATTNIGNPWISALAVDWSDRLHVLAATNGGGLYETFNGGDSWSHVSTLTEDRPYVVTFDPVDADSIYVGTGNGIFKTTDGGVVWTLQNTGLTNTWVNAIVVAPSDPLRVYLGTVAFSWLPPGGVFVSEDAGGTWARVGPAFTDVRVDDLGVDPDNPFVVYRTTSPTKYPYTDPVGSHKSIDGGLTWSALGNPSKEFYIRDLDVARDGTEQIYTAGDAVQELTLCRPSLTCSLPGGGDSQSWISGTEVQINGGVGPGSGCSAISRVSWRWGDGVVADSWFPAQHTYAAAGEYGLMTVGIDLAGGHADDAGVLILGETDQSVSGTLDEPTVIQAAESITATDLHIVYPAAVTFIAGQKVVLGDGFSIDEQCSLVVILDAGVTAGMDVHLSGKLHGGHIVVGEGGPERIEQNAGR